MGSCLFRIQYADGRVEERVFGNGTFRIGRERGDVILQDPGASGAHAEIAVHGANVTYTDLGSSNGSFDGNDRRLTGSTPLTPGQSVQIGRSAITFLGAPASARAVAASGTSIPRTLPPGAAASGAPAPTATAIAASSPLPGSGAYSHPDRAVRHSYPLAITAAGLSDAFRLLMQTAPFVLARLGVLSLMSLAAILWWVLLVGGFSLLHATPLLAWAWLLFLCFVAGSVWRLGARYVLYLLKAAHIAVLTELITTGRINNGSEGMFHYGRRVVTERFGEVNVMFGLDLLIDGIVRAFNRTLSFVSNLLPIPGLDSVMGLVRSVLKASTTYIDETIFSYNLARGDQNAYRSSKDGLVYYAQNSKEILKTGLWVVVVERVLSFLIWLVMLAPAFAIAALMPGAISLAGLVIAFLFAANLRSAVLHPLLLTMVLVKYHALVRGQGIDLEWDQRLDVATTKFGELKKKAEAWVRPAPTPQPTPSAQPA
jgi:hypothetical protein